MYYNNYYCFVWNLYKLFNGDNMKKNIFEDWDWEEVDETIIEEDSHFTSTGYIYDCYDDLYKTEECSTSQWSSGSSSSSIKPKTKHTYSKYIKKPKRYLKPQSINSRIIGSRRSRIRKNNN